MLKNGIFCEMVILVVFKGFLLVKNLENLVQMVPDCSIYSYYDDIILMYFFDIISMDGKSTQLQRASFINVLLKDKTS